MKKVTLLMSLMLMSGIVTTSFAQKVKYKDIFPLLEKKKYDEAEPLLQRYLERDADNPNAVLYMGIVKMNKYQKMQTTDATVANAAREDAVRYLTKAKELVDEWEVSKNEKYYVYYKRRNLRSGEMEVSVSDIRLDIDNRLRKLKGEKSEDGTE